MQLNEFKEFIQSLGTVASFAAADVGSWLSRIDADGDDVVVTLQTGELALQERLKVEAKLVQEFARQQQKNLQIIFKSSTKAKFNSLPPEQEQSKGAFGVKYQTQAIPGVDKVICVASGKGGVGKSTVAVNLALSLRNAGKKVGIMDADLYGPSIPKMLGCEGIIPEVVDGEIVPLEVNGVKAISFASLNPGDAPLIWRGPMVGKALTQFFYQVAWDELDYLVIDLPPGTGDVQLTMIEKLPVHGAVIVSSPQDLALIDAAKAVQMFRKLKIPILGLIENMSIFTCDNCGHEHEIFGHGAARNYAQANNIPFLGEVPLHKAYRYAGDTGVPVATDGENPHANVFRVAVDKMMIR